MISYKLILVEAQERIPRHKGMNRFCENKQFDTNMIKVEKQIKKLQSFEVLKKTCPIYFHRSHPFEYLIRFHHF